MNTRLFRIYMVKNGDKQSDLAKAMGIAQSALSMKINGKTEFRKNEIIFIMKRWNLTGQETMDIFFNDEVSCGDTIPA